MHCVKHHVKHKVHVRCKKEDAKTKMHNICTAGAKQSKERSHCFTSSLHGVLASSLHLCTVGALCTASTKMHVQPLHLVSFALHLRCIRCTTKVHCAKDEVINEVNGVNGDAKTKMHCTQKCTAHKNAHPVFCTTLYIFDAYSVPFACTSFYIFDLQPLHMHLMRL